VPGESSEAKRVLSGGFAKALSAELRPPERAGGREQCIEYSQKSRRLAGWRAGGAALSGTHCAKAEEGRKERRSPARDGGRSHASSSSSSPSSSPLDAGSSSARASLAFSPFTSSSADCTCAGTANADRAATHALYNVAAGSQCSHPSVATGLRGHSPPPVGSQRCEASCRRTEAGELLVLQYSEYSQLASFWYYSTVSTHSWRPFDT
jgi:hypothetical protein